MLPDPRPVPIGSTEKWLVRAAKAAPVVGFDPDDLTGVPAAARDYLTFSIARGTPLAAGARLEMRGQIKLKRWLPFRARQVLVPHIGTVWSARVGGIIVGSDRYAAGEGGMLWRLFGLIPVVKAGGPDVTRSSAERAGGESVWVPTALHPVNGVSWTRDDRALRANFAVDDRYPVSLEFELDTAGAPTAVAFDRWADPDQTGEWRTERFGVRFTRTGRRDGVTIPVAGRAGWHYGTDRWADGEFFRYEITRFELLRP